MLNLVYGHLAANREQINNHFLSTLEPGTRKKSVAGKKKCKVCVRDGKNTRWNTHHDRIVHMHNFTLYKALSSYIILSNSHTLQNIVSILKAGTHIGSEKANDLFSHGA